MSAGIRPSSDKPIEKYYQQPWWVREAIRTAEILRKTDLTALNERDIKVLQELQKALEETLSRH